MFEHLDLDWDPRYAMLENRLERVATDKLRSKGLRARSSLLA